jgi:hypothetical protein
MSVELTATPGEDAARTAGVERLPTGSAHVGTHHLEALLSSLGLAQAATRPGDIRGYTERVAEHLLYASRHLESVMGQWRELNARVDRAVAFLNEHPEATAPGVPDPTPVGAVVARRICWPAPGTVCLEGGCGYCNDQPFRNLTVIRAEAVECGRLDAYLWGDSHGWANAETRTGRRKPATTTRSKR